MNYQTLKGKIYNFCLQNPLFNRILDLMSQTQPQLHDLRFLEVTINSNKLNTLLQKLFQQLAEQKLEIGYLKDTLSTIKKSVSNAIDGSENRMQEWMRVSLNKIREQMRNNLIEQDKVNKSIGMKYDELDKVVQNKSIEIENLNDLRTKCFEIEHDFNIQNQLKQNAFTEVKADIDSIKSNSLNIENIIEEAKKKTQDEFEFMFMKIKSMLTDEGSAPKKKKRVQLSQTLFKKQKENHGPSKINPTTAQNYARFSFKMKALQQQIQKSNMGATCPEKLGQFLEEKSEYDHQTEQQYLVKYAALSKEVKEYQKELKQEIASLKNKNTILEERILIQLRKTQKSEHKIEQLRTALKKNKDKKGDQELIEILRNQLQKAINKLEDDIELKIYKDTFEKEKSKIIEKIHLLQENLTEKADKGQIKKAILFLQGKLKQIILLIANQQIEQKNGAIKKIPAKCLSCDKALELEAQFMSRPPSPKTNRDTRLSVTRKIRKRQQFSSRQVSPNVSNIA